MAPSKGTVVDPVVVVPAQPAVGEAAVGDVAPPLMVVKTSSLEAHSLEHRRKWKVDLMLNVSRIPLFLPGSEKYGPDVLNELQAMLGGVDKALKYLCSTMQDVGPGFKVSLYCLGSSSPRD